MMNKQLIIDKLNDKDIEVNRNIVAKMKKKEVEEGIKLKKEIDEFVSKYTNAELDMKTDRNIKFFINNVYFKEKRIDNMSIKILEELGKETGKEFFNSIIKFRKSVEKIKRLNKLGKAIKKKDNKYIINLEFDYNINGLMQNKNQMLKFSKEETMLIFQSNILNLETSEEIQDAITKLEVYGYNFIFSLGKSIYFQNNKTYAIFINEYENKITYLKDIKSEFKEENEEDKKRKEQEEKEIEQEKERMKKQTEIMENPYHLATRNYQEFLDKYKEVIAEYVITNGRMLFIYENNSDTFTNPKYEESLNCIVDEGIAYYKSRTTYLLDKLSEFKEEEQNEIEEQEVKREINIGRKQDILYKDNYKLKDDEVFLKKYNNLIAEYFIEEDILCFYFRDYNIIFDCPNYIDCIKELVDKCIGEENVSLLEYQLKNLIIKEEERENNKIELDIDKIESTEINVQELFFKSKDEKELFKNLDDIITEILPKEIEIINKTQSLNGLKINCKLNFTINKDEAYELLIINNKISILPEIPF